LCDQRSETMAAARAPEAIALQGRQCKPVTMRFFNFLAARARCGLTSIQPFGTYRRACLLSFRNFVPAQVDRTLRTFSFFVFTHTKRCPWVILASAVPPSVAKHRLPAALSSSLNQASAFAGRGSGSCLEPWLHTAMRRSWSGPGAVAAAERLQASALQRLDGNPAVLGAPRPLVRPSWLRTNSMSALHSSSFLGERRASHEIAMTDAPMVFSGLARMFVQCRHIKPPKSPSPGRRPQRC